MKRLLSILSGMKTDEKHFTRMYDGPIRITQGSIDYDDNSNTYWDNDVGYTIECASKAEQDKPLVRIMIPARKLGLDDIICPGADAEDLRIITSNSTVHAADALLREFPRFIDPYDAARSNPFAERETGHYIIHRPGGEVLARNTAYFAVCPTRDYENLSGINVRVLPEGELTPPTVCLCLEILVKLPERKLKRAITMLTKELPRAIREFIDAHDREKIQRAVILGEKQQAIRNFLSENGYFAFIANGSVLPRQTTENNTYKMSRGGPLKGASPFISPPEDEIEIAGVRGMALRRGVTVVTGGGYSGKSTLLDAISAGIYDHHEGDGRELVLTDPTAVIITAEDGRSVSRRDISRFIKWIPGSDPGDFSTAHASGSTSQAANIAEAIASGAKLLLIDEDLSATNFMIRDARMKKLIEHEPITPFTDIVRPLADEGVSTILVIGGSGEYLSVADKILMMDNFILSDATEKARKIAGYTPPPRGSAEIPANPPTAPRAGKGFSTYKELRGKERFALTETGFLLFGRETTDLRPIRSITSPEMANAIALILREAANRLAFGGGNFVPDELIDSVLNDITKNGLDSIRSNRYDNIFLEMPRKVDISAVIDRMREIVY